MFLSRLSGVSKIGEFNVCEHSKDSIVKVVHCDQLIVIDHSDDSIKFDMQQGSIAENGVNGCDIKTLIQTAKMMLEKTNQAHSNEWIYEATEKLSDALFALDKV